MNSFYKTLPVKSSSWLQFGWWWGFFVSKNCKYGLMTSPHAASVAVKMKNKLLLKCYFNLRPAEAKKSSTLIHVFIPPFLLRVSKKMYIKLSTEAMSLLLNAQFNNVAVIAVSIQVSITHRLCNFMLEQI